MAYPPERIVCLTEETVEALYLMGREHLIAGVTGYAVRPARVRKEKPRVAAFTSANTGKILALKPDLVAAGGVVEPGDPGAAVSPCRRSPCPPSQSVRECRDQGRPRQSHQA